MKTINDAVQMAKEIAKKTGQRTCVVERRDCEGGVLEYAVADVGVSCNENECVIWEMEEVASTGERGSRNAVENREGITSKDNAHLCDMERKPGGPVPHTSGLKS